MSLKQWKYEEINIQVEYVKSVQYMSPYMN